MMALTYPPIIGHPRSMAIANSIKDILKHPAARRGWVAAQLRLRGTSFRAIANREGVSYQAVAQALAVPSERLERVLAKELSLRVQDLFPERYDRRGVRTCASRPRTANPTDGDSPRNVEDREVA